SAPLLAGGRRRLGWLDDVRRGRLGRVRGILAGRGELLLQLLDSGLEGGELSAQGVDLSLQPLAIGTRRHRIGFHGSRVYTNCNSDSTLGTATAFCKVRLIPVELRYGDKVAPTWWLARSPRPTWSAGSRGSSRDRLGRWSSAAASPIPSHSPAAVGSSRDCTPA